jgi:hypothetical protein
LTSLDSRNGRVALRAAALAHLQLRVINEVGPTLYDVNRPKVVVEQKVPRIIEPAAGEDADIFIEIEDSRVQSKAHNALR